MLAMARQQNVWYVADYPCQSTPSQSQKILSHTWSKCCTYNNINKSSICKIHPILSTNSPRCLFKITESLLD